MSEPWFDPRLGWGALVAFFLLHPFYIRRSAQVAQRGEARALMLGLNTAFLGVGLAMLTFGLVCMMAGQPRLVWAYLVIPGLLALAFCPVHRSALLWRYGEVAAGRPPAPDAKPPLTRSWGCLPALAALALIVWHEVLRTK